MKRSYIYTIENLLNSSVYIGKTTNPQKRWADHKFSAGLVENPRVMTPLYRAMRKYGIENFEFKIIDEHEDERYTLEVLEPQWISHYREQGRRVYNLTNGGDGIPGYSHTIETRKRMSIAQRGHKVTIEQRKKISETLRGNVIPEETRKKISEKTKGRPKPPRSDEHRRKLSGVARARGPMPEEQKKKISDSLKTSTSVGHPIDEETKKKIGDAQRGRVHTEEERSKRSESIRKFHEERRARGEQVKQRERTPEEKEETKRKRAESMRRYHEGRRTAEAALASEDSLLSRDELEPIAIDA